MHEIRSYRDTPKPGETDAKWCAYEVCDGHVRRQTGGHETEAEARAALGETTPPAIWSGATARQRVGGTFGS